MILAADCRFRIALAVVLAGAVLLPRLAHAQSAAVVLDGRFTDWTGPVEHVDPAGDAGAGVDLRQVDLANDEAFLFVRLQTTSEIGIQESASDLVLYLDTDMNAGTGLAIGGIGAELRWNFGSRNGCFAPVGSCLTVYQDDIRLRMGPTVTSSEFEIAIGRNALPDGAHALFPGASFRLLLVDTGSGDMAPNAGGLAYSFDPTPVGNPEPAPFARVAEADVRVVTWNARDLEGGSGYDPAAVAAADRVLSAIAPDVVCFQELYNTTASQVRSLVESMLPERGSWYGAKQADCAVVSRYPVLQSWALDGNLAVLLDADAALDTDLLLVAAHLPCCTNDAGRQREIDRIMQFFRDAKAPGGSVEVPAGTAFMIAGDLNLVGFAQQLRTLLTGDIADEATFGPDFAPDWDGTALDDVISSQTERRFAYTWRDDLSSFAPGRLDFVIYNDSVLRLRHHYIVYSPEMSGAALAATGIQAADVTTVSDHLPHVADFRSVADVTGVEGPAAPAFGLGTRTLVGRGGIHFVLELDAEAAIEIAVFDVRGRRVRAQVTAGSRVLGPGRFAMEWDGTDDHGRHLPAGFYYARATARSSMDGHERSAIGRWVLLR